MQVADLRSIHIALPAYVFYNNRRERFDAISTSEQQCATQCQWMHYAVGHDVVELRDVRDFDEASEAVNHRKTLSTAMQWMKLYSA